MASSILASILTISTIFHREIFSSATFVIHKKSTVTSLAVPPYEMLLKSTLKTSCETGVTSNSDHDENDDAVSLKSGISLLEHININIPDHSIVRPFYVDLLNLALDPRKAINVYENNNKTVWANCGASQFHLPHGDNPQVIPGIIGLGFSSLESLKERLTNSEHNFEYEIVNAENSPSGRELIELKDGYGNIFHARKVLPNWPTELCNVRTMKQPIIRDDDTDNHDLPHDFVTKYGKEYSSMECLGIDYVEFRCPSGTARKIAEFYECVFGAVTDVVTIPSVTGEEEDETDIAIVACGEVNREGRAAQNIIFKESNLPMEPYDGHHIAIYAGETVSDFELVFKNCEQAGLVWVNPRFSDKAMSLTGAKKWNQFRFKDILDLKSGKVIFTLEHEVRSVDHSSYPGKE